MLPLPTSTILDTRAVHAKIMPVDDDWLNVAFGVQLRARRVKAQMSQDVLAEEARLSRTSIVNIEQGRQGVSLATLYRLADALACSPADLLPIRPDVEVPTITIGDRSLESQRAVRLVKQADKGGAI
jgi:transcriptional regulator with XRE-family HTH domain